VLIIPQFRSAVKIDRTDVTIASACVLDPNPQGVVVVAAVLPGEVMAAACATGVESYTAQRLLAPL